MPNESKRILQKKKAEFSQRVCVIAALAFFFLGAWMVWRYYELMEIAINGMAAVAPDAALPIAGITFIFSPIVSYLVYQFGLKNSRNKYGVDENGEPYIREIGGDC